MCSSDLDLVDRLRQRKVQAMHPYPFGAIVEQLQVITRPGKPIQAHNRGAQLFGAEPRRDRKIFIVVDAHRRIVPAIQTPRIKVECGIILTGLGVPGSLTTKFIRAGGEIGRRTRFRS